MNPSWYEKCCAEANLVALQASAMLANSTTNGVDFSFDFRLEGFPKTTFRSEFIDLVKEKLTYLNITCEEIISRQEIIMGRENRCWLSLARTRKELIERERER